MESDAQDVLLFAVQGPMLFRYGQLMLVSLFSPPLQVGLGEKVYGNLHTSVVNSQMVKNNKCSQ